MDSQLRVRVKYPVTAEMLEAGGYVWDRLGQRHPGLNQISLDDVLHDLYITMRALEPGLACEGVMQQPGANPYAAKR